MKNIVVLINELNEFNKLVCTNEERKKLNMLLDIFKFGKKLNLLSLLVLKI